jgi:hypothetical protein
MLNRVLSRIGVFFISSKGHTVQIHLILYGRRQYELDVVRYMLFGKLPHFQAGEYFT